MADASITYFPVGNGDTSLIKLADGTGIIIDINVCQDEDEERYDVHSHLIQQLRTDSSKVRHCDAFILSHADQDHTRGFSTVFYTGDPDKYSEKDRTKNRIIIDELWFSPRIFCPFEKDLCDDAKELKKEAERRIAVYRKGGADAKKPGNRIRIIGFTDNPDLADLKAIVTVPGSSINLINGLAKSDFSFFVHAPTKKDTDSKWAERNDTSIVLQARFKVDDQERAALALFGGDAGCGIWSDIISKSTNDDLEFDLFLAPHHCSWTFFSETPSEENEPDDKIITFLTLCKRKGAIAISSSKPIKDDDDNPPHHLAAEKYREILGAKNLLCTGEHPNEKSPEPIYFTMTANGPVKDEPVAKSQVKSSAAIAAVVTQPKTYG
jgi:hypothetical protein